jgi:hypothetical protein
MRLDMPEMLECAEVTFAVCGLEAEPVDVMGHSQGGFIALAFAIERPERVPSRWVPTRSSGWP